MSAVTLPPAPREYDVRDQAEVRRAVERALQQIIDPRERREVTGSRASGAALVSLLAALDSLGLIVDQTTA